MVAPLCLYSTCDLGFQPHKNTSACSCFSISFIPSALSSVSFRLTTFLLSQITIKGRPLRYPGGPPAQDASVASLISAGRRFHASVSNTRFSSHHCIQHISQWPPTTTACFFRHSSRKPRVSLVCPRFTKSSLNTFPRYVDARIIMQ